jgi:hypothetical protein
MAAYTIWVDPVTGNDSNDGLSHANAVKTNTGLHDVIESKANNDEFTINLVNSAKHTWDRAEFVGDVVDCTFTFRGTDSSGNPAWTIVHHEDGSGNLSSQAYLRLDDHAGVTIEYLDFDNTLAPGPSGTWAFITALGTTAGDVLIHYCKINGGATAADGGDEATAIYPYYRESSTGTNTENFTVEYNLIQNADGIMQAWYSDTLTWTFRRNVVSIVDSTETVWTMQHAARTVFEYNTIVLVTSGASLSYRPCISAVYSANNGSESPYPQLILANNVIYKETSGALSGTMSTSYTQIGSGSISNDSTLESGSSIGYNFLYAGPNATAADVASTNGYKDNPFSPDDGTYYSTDLLTTGVTLADVFKDPNSTYDWTPQDGGSALTIEVPKDYRLIVNGADGENGTTPGALPSPTTEYTVTAQITKTVISVGSATTVRIGIANSGQAASGVTVDVTIPSGLSLVSSTPSAGTFDGSTWTVGALADEASELLTLSLLADSGTEGEELTVTGDLGPSPSPDSGGTSTETASVTVSILAPPPEEAAETRAFIDALPLKRPVLTLDVNSRLRTKRNRADEHYLRGDIEEQLWSEFRTARLTLGTEEEVELNLSGVLLGSYLMVESDEPVQVSTLGTSAYLPQSKAVILGQSEITQLAVKNPSTTSTANVLLVVVD